MRQGEALNVEESVVSQQSADLVYSVLYVP